MWAVLSMALNHLPDRKGCTMADIPQWWMKGHWFDV
jgi:hypothetical protein